jgi:hypothetical protein
MRPIVLLGLTLTLPLAGCGDTWWNPPLTGGFNPHRPGVDSDNMRRVIGQDAPTAALESEPGDVWPGPLPPTPTLSDMEGTMGIGSAAQQPNYGTSAATGARPARAAAPVAAPASPARTAPVVVPNGNGTSTAIHPDGRIETIPTPK